MVDRAKDLDHASAAQPKIRTESGFE